MLNNNIVRISSIILTLLMLCTGVSFAEPNGYFAELYVDAGSKTDGTGTLNNPFRTLGSARAAVRKLNQGMNGDIVVYLKGGTYFLDETEVFTPLDSGMNGCNVVYKAYGGEKPIISGGKAVDNWSMFDEGKNIYRAPLTETEYLRQLYVNGTRAIRARSEDDYLNKDNSLLTDSGYKTTISKIAGWNNISDIESVYSWHWCNPRCAWETAEAADDGVNIKMSSSMWESIFRYESLAGNYIDYPWYIENAYELLDEPGEFYFNRQEKKVYYMPRAGENMNTAEVIAPALETLFRVEGTPDDTVHNISFEGISFYHTALYTADLNRGWNDIQNNIVVDMNHAWEASAAEVNYADHISFTSCEFAHLGGFGLIMDTGVNNSPITGNLFYDIAASAVAVGNFRTIDNGSFNYTDNRFNTYKNDITNNYIHDTSFYYRGGAGVSLGYVYDINLSNNDIGNLPYSGIHVNWGFDGNLVKGNLLRNIKVKNNYIYNTMNQRLYDGGCIYALGATGGTLDNMNEISGNYIKNTMHCNGPGGIYTDEGSSYWKIKNNVLDFYDVPMDEMKGISLFSLYSWIKTESYIYIEDNFTTWPKTRMDAVASHEKNTVARPDCNWNETAMSVIKSAGIEKEYREKLGGAAREGFDKIIIDKELYLNIGESITIPYRVVNALGEDMDSSSYKMSFESRNPDKVAVNVNSVTAVEAGRADVEVTVQSDGKQYKKNITVYSGTEINSVKFTDEVAKMFVGDTHTANVECTSNLDSKINDCRISYSSSDTSVATVTEEGIITAAGGGDCIITSTAEYKGKSVSAERVINVRSVSKFDATGLDVVDICDDFNDAKGWKTGKATDVVKNERRNTIEISTPSGWAAYAGKKYGNQLLDFNMCVNSIDDGWPTICFGMHDSNENPVSGTDVYLVTLKKDNIELQRFNRGKRKIFFGYIDGELGEGGILKNQYINYGATNRIQIGSINMEDGGVRLIFNVNGYSVFDFADYGEGRITAPGYFGCINQSGSFVFSKKSDISASEKTYSEFSDIGSHWAKNDISRLQQKGIVSGDETGCFRPEATITRAELIAMAARLLDINSDGVKVNFSDVSPEQWYFDSVMAAYKYNLIDYNLTANDCVLPENPITREEIASILINTYIEAKGVYPNSADISGFADCGSISGWAVKYIKWANGISLINGDDNGNLNSGDFASRAEACAMVYRLYTLIYLN